MAEVPLAEASGGVALGFEMVRDGVFLRVHARGAIGVQNPFVHAHRFRVATR